MKIDQVSFKSNIYQKGRYHGKVFSKYNNILFQKFRVEKIHGSRVSVCITVLIILLKK